MAKAEFYEILIRDRRTDNRIEKNIIKLIKEKLSQLDENDLLCSNKTCFAILSDSLGDENSFTLDFSKLSSEVVNSTIISKPLDSIDTFEEFNKLESDKAVPTNEEINYILQLTSEYEKEELVNKLITSDVEYFTTFKILRNNTGIITQDELDMFCNKTIQRMKKEKIFFNISNLEYKKNTFLLTFQKAMHGFEIEHLYKYLNSHLLKNEGIEIHFKKIYDVSFMDALQNSEIKNFKFSYNAESKNNLLDENFATPLYLLTKMLGNSVTINVNNKDDILDNKKLLNFFEMANEAGLLETCKIKKIGSQKEINSSDKGLELNYTTRYPIDNISQAHNFFLEAYLDKEQHIYSRIS